MIRNEKLNNTDLIGIKMIIRKNTKNLVLCQQIRQIRCNEKKILERHKLPSLTQIEIANLISIISIKDIEFMIKEISQTDWYKIKWYVILPYI